MSSKGFILLPLLAIAASLLAAATQPRMAQAEPFVYGDVNCSGDVDSIDALLMLQAVAFQTRNFPCPKNFDLDNNGALTASDALLALQFHARLLQRLGPSDETVPAVALALGEKHSCALTAPGGLKCWGDNSSGQLGDGTTWSRRIPVDVAAPSQHFAAVTAGLEHTCGLTDAGAVKCWGRNDLGQLGNGMRTGPQLCFDPFNPSQGYACSSTPVDVTGLASGVTSIAAGADHTCAVLASGRVKCWGFAEGGRLGAPASELCTRFEHTCSTVPVEVATLDEGVAMIRAGFGHTCVVTDTGDMWCWGENADGQLGDGTTTTRDTPVQVMGLTDTVAALALGYLHTCALTTAGAVKCWGHNVHAELGTSPSTCIPALTGCHSTTPLDVAGLGSQVLGLAAGGWHNCALTAKGGVKCWGAAGNRELGAEGQEQCLWGPCSSTPLDVAGLSSSAVDIAAGSAHSCAIVDGGAVECWGQGAFDQLGAKTPFSEENQCICSQVPVSVVGFGSAAR
jgi:alpha-tubulin suppressor-like RCC1 family protein